MDGLAIRMYKEQKKKIASTQSWAIFLSCGFFFSLPDHIVEDIFVTALSSFSFSPDMSFINRPTTEKPFSRAFAPIQQQSTTTL